MANGIASDRGGVNVAPIAAVGADNPVTPGVGDLMASFRSGFITVDDLVRRGVTLPGAVAAAGQDFQDQQLIRPLAREAQIGQLQTEIAIQPRRASNLAATEDLRQRQIDEAGRQLPTETEIQADTASREKTAQLANALNSTVPGVRDTAIANASAQSVLDLWAQAHGQPAPETIQVPGGGVEPKMLEEWIFETYGPNALQGDAQAFVNRPDVQAGYQKYANEARNRPLTLFKGEPEYINKLREDLKAANLKEALQAAQIKAVPSILEAQAKAGGEAGTKQSTAINQLLTRIENNDVLKNHRTRLTAVKQVADLSQKPNPSNQDDLGLIYATVRALDPVSAVREGEISLLQKGVGLPNQLVTQFNRLFGNSNAVLTPDVRQGFLGLARTQEQSSWASALPEYQKFVQNVTAENLPLERVFTAPEIQRIQGGSATVTTPSPGVNVTVPQTPSVPAPGSEPIIVNRSTGQRMVLRNGQWQPL